MADTKTKQLVTKGMKLGEIIEKYPAAAEVMQSFGLQCVGCHVSPYETLEAGAKGHGMSDEKIQELLDEVNDVAGKAPVKKDVKEGDKGTLILKPKAVFKLKEIMKEQGKEGYAVRIQVTSGGCAGFMYGMDFEQSPGPEDEVLEFDGLKVLVDKKSFDMLRGVEVDYVESLQNSGFQFNNPNAEANCGCGKSFR